jgi:spermidine synthase
MNFHWARAWRRPEITLFVAGFSLILLQFFMIREITAMLKGTEMVILMVTAAYFTGYSVGYGLAPYVGGRFVRLAALLTWGLHLTLPFSLRWLGGAGASTLGFGATFYLALFVAAFLLSSFFSLLLPRFIDEMTVDGADGATPLIRLYAAELIGALVGAGAIFVVGRFGPLPLTLLYQIGLGATVALVIGGRAMAGAAAIGVATYAFCFQPAWDASQAFYYNRLYAHISVIPLFSAYTPYQKVDIIEAASGRRYIYLDGLQNYGDIDLSLFNAYLTGVPHRLRPGGDTLIVGAGSMESVAWASPVAATVTTVEIDAAVLAGATTWLADANRLAEATNWTPVVADAKHHLGHNDRKYDLIIMDIPAPLTIQVGLLYSRDFFELAKSRLKPGGLLAVTLAGTFDDEQITSRTVAAGLVAVFERVVPFHPKIVGRSFAIAGAADAFDEAAVAEAAAALGKGEVVVYSDAETRTFVEGIRPMTIDDMSYPVRRSWRRVRLRALENWR